jgi:hypothetical protein
VVTRKFLVALAKSPAREQSTSAVEVPGPVRDPTVQVHETLPVELAVLVGARPLAVETVPDA